MPIRRQDGGIGGSPARRAATQGILLTDLSAPVLSICIPSYNREALALELLGELDAPGFLPFDFEVVLVDNASSTSAYDTVRGFAPQHYPLRYIRLDRTVTVFENVWGSLRRALGTFCLYMADDDRLTVGRVPDIE